MADMTVNKFNIQTHEKWSDASRLHRHEYLTCHLHSNILRCLSSHIFTPLNWLTSHKLMCWILKCLVLAIFASYITLKGIAPFGIFQIWQCRISNLKDVWIIFHLVKEPGHPPLICKNVNDCYFRSHFEKEDK